MFRKWVIKLRHCEFSQVRNSALFVNGAKATQQFVYVSPHIDITEKLINKDATTQQLIKRKSNLNLNKIEDLWAVYKELKSKKLEYEGKKGEISTELSKLIKTDPDGEITKKFKIQIDLIKDNIRKLKEPLWSAEEAAMLEALKLPNSLHQRTLEQQTIFFKHLEPPKNKKNHLQIGKERNLLKFTKNENYYFTGEAAIFELGAKFYFSSILKSNNFIQFSNADFVKSLIVEGCGTDHTDPDFSFILHHNEDTEVNKDTRLHLTGSASLTSFLAYHTKNVIYPKVLPLKYFTMGRQYNPSADKEDSLFHVSQSSVIEVFGVTKTAEDLDNLLDSLVETLKNVYSMFGYHFRLIIAPAEKLQMWESLRISIQMYSTSLERYVEVGNISLSGDFIAKRLMYTYVEDKQHKFPYLLSGTVLNVPKLLACVLEQDKDFVMPEMFQLNNWKM